MTPNLPISKIRKTFENKLIETMHYCIEKMTLKLYDKNRTEHGHLAFHFDPVGRPHRFSEQVPTFVNPALSPAMLGNLAV